jgi:phenylalanine ammonia-lyase
MFGHYDARRTLSPATVPIYDAVRRVTGRPASAQRPFLWNDNEQFLDAHLARVVADIAAGGEIAETVADLVARLQELKG